MGGRPFRRLVSPDRFRHAARAVALDRVEQELHRSLDEGSREGTEIVSGEDKSGRGQSCARETRPLLTSAGGRLSGERREAPVQTRRAGSATSGEGGTHL